MRNLAFRGRENFSLRSKWQKAATLTSQVIQAVCTKESLSPGVRITNEQSRNRALCPMDLRPQRSHGL